MRSRTCLLLRCSRLQYQIMSTASRLLTRFVRTPSCRPLPFSPRNQGQLRWHSSDDDTEIRSSENGESTLFLHVGPSGDCWTGYSIFAAKHLQPDYVRSVALPRNCDEAQAEALLEAIDGDTALQRQIYDEKRIPETLFSKLKQKHGAR